MNEPELHTKKTAELRIDDETPPSTTMVTKSTGAWRKLGTEHAMKNHQLSQRVVGMGSALKLGHATRFVLKHAPTGLQAWADNCRSRILNWHWTNILEAGYELVPADALERRYRESLLMLTTKYGADSLGDYLEFGVCKGTSMACMFHALQSVNLTDVRLFGFDSFEGLPDTARTDDGGSWVPGQFRCDSERTKACLTQSGVDWRRVVLVKGWFSETLNDRLIRRHGITKASVIMIDCDMYLSAKEALTICAPLIHDAAIIFFDDWHSLGLAERNLGEKRAFDEFLRANPQFTVEGLGGYNPNSEIFLLQRRRLVNENCV